MQDGPGDRRLTRRAVLVGGAGVVAAAATGGALVENGVMPGRSRLHRLLGWDRSPVAKIPDRRPGPRIEGTFESSRRRMRTGWSVSYPPGAVRGAHLPVLVSLHGKGGDHRTSFDGLGLDRFLADAVARGARPFAVASVDGGDSYWHPRVDGSDSGAMVTEEFVPLLRDHGLDTGRLGLFGWSMGGYGSLLLASDAGPGAIRVVATSSAALWTRWEDSAPGAFDDASDFADHDVFNRRTRIGALPLRMDCGTADPFVDANRAFVRGLPHPGDGGFQAGGHDIGYWHSRVPGQLAFVGHHLTHA